MVRFFALLYTLLVASTLQAQALAIRTTEIRCTPAGCQQLIGTGACAYIGVIGNRSIYLTAAHNVNQARTIHVGYGGKWWTARVVFQEYQGDIDYAIIDTEKLPAKRCFALSDRLPDNGLEAVAYGYSNGVYQLKSLRSRIRVTPAGRYFSRIVAKGDSGGPILVNGQIVGIIKGHDYQNTIYTGSTLIRRKLLSLYGKLPCCNCDTPAIAEKHPEQSGSSERIVALENIISKLKEQVNELSQTQIPVQIIGEDGQIKQEQKYLLGRPIKLRFKAVNK